MGLESIDSANEETPDLTASSFMDFVNQKNLESDGRQGKELVKTQDVSLIVLTHTPMHRETGTSLKGIRVSMTLSLTAYALPTSITNTSVACVVYQN